MSSIVLERFGAGKLYNMFRIFAHSLLLVNIHWKQLRARDFRSFSGIFRSFVVLTNYTNGKVLGEI